MKKHTTPVLRVIAVMTLTAVVSFQALLTPSTYAAPITTRSLTLQAMDSDPTSGVDGGSKAGGTVRHFYEFTMPGGTNIGSIKFEYCTTAANDSLNPTCIAPTGMNATGATLVDQTGATGFSVLTRTANTIVLTRASTNMTANTVGTYTFDSVVNPLNPEVLPDPGNGEPGDENYATRSYKQNTTFFVRISSYSSVDGSGSPIDSGTVAASTANQIVLSGTMPESLVFCTGRTIGLTNALPDCSTATQGIIEFNQLFSPEDTATSTSQMAASTNAGFGYIITVNGTTLTSGTNTISNMATAGPGIRGTGQFGMNLALNTVATSTVPIGADVSPVANATSYRGEAQTGYNTPDTFKFTSGDTVASSTNGTGTPGLAAATDSQIYTVSYIANVPGSQAAGQYATTLTYICTPTF